MIAGYRDGGNTPPIYPPFFLASALHAAQAWSNVIYICSSYTCLHTGDSTTPLLSDQRVSPLRFVGINKHDNYFWRRRSRLKREIIDENIRHNSSSYSRPSKLRPPFTGYLTYRIHLINGCISFHRCQILSPSETGFIVSAHRLPNITLLTLIATL